MVPPPKESPGPVQPKISVPFMCGCRHVLLRAAARCNYGMYMSHNPLDKAEDFP